MAKIDYSNPDMLRGLSTEDQLTKVYEKWCKKRGYECVSADELLHELLGREKADSRDVEWLEVFIQHWEYVLGPKIPKGYVKVSAHWYKELGKLRCWLDGFNVGRGNSFPNGIPGQDTLRQIQVAIQDAERGN